MFGIIFWIRTAYIWFRKQLLCQLNHNRCTQLRLACLPQKIITQKQIHKNTSFNLIDQLVDLLWHVHVWSGLDCQLQRKLMGFQTVSKTCLILVFTLKIKEAQLNLTHYQCRHSSVKSSVPANLHLQWPGFESRAYCACFS